MDKEIEYRINAANPPSSGYGFINVETWTITTAATNLSNHHYRYNDPFLNNPFDPGDDGYSESLTCWWWTFYFCEDSQSCESPARQSYWTNSTWNAATKIRQTYCLSKDFKVCTMGSLWWVVPGIIEPYYGHTCSFSYGLKILR
jgi:hypothetical protein